LASRGRGDGGGGAMGKKRATARTSFIGARPRAPRGWTAVILGFRARTRGWHRQGRRGAGAGARGARVRASRRRRLSLERGSRVPWLGLGEGCGWALGRWGGERSWAGGRSGPRARVGPGQGRGRPTGLAGEGRRGRKRRDSAQKNKKGFPFLIKHNGMKTKGVGEDSKGDWIKSNGA